jgi:hypothetical protein
VIGAEVKATAARHCKMFGWELSGWRSKLAGLNISE